MERTHTIGRPGASKGRTFPPEPLTEHEVELLILSCSNKAPTGIRKRALIATLYRCGLRISEALALLPQHIDIEQGTVRVMRSKKGGSRVVGLDTGTGAMIQRWLDVRFRKFGINGRTAVFTTLEGRVLSGQYVRALLHRKAAQCGITKRVAPHQLRHSFAYSMAEEQQPLLVIMHALGHKNVSTTSRYIDHVRPEQVIEAMKSRAPLVG